jgi:hypothetical protein
MPEIVHVARQLSAKRVSLGVIGETPRGNRPDL